MADGVIRIGPYEGINNCWKNQPAFVIACSQALRGIDLNKLDGLNTITVNHLIEDYDKSKFHLFLDQRFLAKTTYDLRNYKGKVFQKNNTEILKGVKKTCRFKPRYQKQTVSKRIEDGLWNNCNSGVAALNLAIITGANPIYLLGHDHTNLDKSKGHHYKTGYTGEKIDNGKGMLEKQHFYNKFIPFNRDDRIINVCKKEISTMKLFKTIEFDEIDLDACQKKRYKVVQSTMNICHIGVMKSMTEMGDISRNVFNSTIGHHYYHQYSEKVPNIKFPPADVYILECFKNSHKLYRNIKKPNIKSKIVSILHSSEPCAPSIESDVVVTLTDYYFDKLKDKYKNLVKISAGIKNYLYKYPVDYDKNTIVRFSRNNEEKIHPQSHRIIKRLIRDHGVKYKFYCDNKEGTRVYDEFEYITDVKIHQEEKKAFELSQCGIYAIANNDFPPIVILDEPTANLDSELAGQAMDQIYELHKKTGITFLIATHDINLIRDGIRAIELVDGKINRDGLVVSESNKKK